jgi:hypothetical protein
LIFLTFLHIVACPCDKKCDMKNMAGTSMPQRTKAQAWADYERLAADRGWHPLVIERARIAFENDDPPWCWEEYLEEGTTPFAPESMVKQVIAEVVAKNGAPVGEPRLWPAVRTEIASRGFRVRKKTVRDLAPKAKAGRPKISPNS